MSAWQQGQGLGNYQPIASPAEAISQRISAIDRELAQFSEQRLNELLTERARLLMAQEALRGGP